MFIAISDPVMIAAIAAISAAVTSILALRKADSTHKIVNSRMSELLALAKKSSHAEGVIEGKKTEKAAERDTGKS